MNRFVVFWIFISWNFKFLKFVLFWTTSLCFFINWRCKLYKRIGNFAIRIRNLIWLIGIELASIDIQKVLNFPHVNQIVFLITCTISLLYILLKKYYFNFSICEPSSLQHLLFANLINSWMYIEFLNDDQYNFWSFRFPKKSIIWILKVSTK